MKLLVLLCSMLARTGAFLQAPVGTMHARRHRMVRNMFGFGKKTVDEGAGIPGFVEKFDLDLIDREKSVTWLQGWATAAVVDTSLMGDEFVFPFAETPIEDGVTITFKYLEAGEIVPVGKIDMRIIMEGNATATEGPGCVQVTRQDPTQTKAFLGESVVIGSMVASLAEAAADSTIDPDSVIAAAAAAAEAAAAAGLTSSPESPAAGASEVTGSVDSETLGNRRRAPWQVFLDDLNKN